METANELTQFAMIFNMIIFSKSAIAYGQANYLESFEVFGYSATVILLGHLVVNLSIIAFESLAECKKSRKRKALKKRQVADKASMKRVKMTKTSDANQAILKQIQNQIPKTKGNHSLNQTALGLSVVDD